MRASSALTGGLVLALTIAAATDAAAHRREDYLQTARIGIEPDRVLITVDLTPGIAVAEALIAAVDRDRDGSLSLGERRAYARAAVRALEMEVDERPIPPRLVSSSFPSPAALRRGEGTIRLTIDAPLAGVPAGAHRLLFRNTHLGGHSAYLANALVPESARVRVTSQHRDRNQAELIIEYTLRPDPGATLAWVTGGLAAALMMARRTSFSLP